MTFAFIPGIRSSLGLLRAQTGSAVHILACWSRASSTSARMPPIIAGDVDQYQMFINGKFVSSRTETLIEVLSPATNKAIATIQDATVDDIDLAVNAAAKCFKDRNGPWRQTTPEQRAVMMKKMADVLESQKETFASIESDDCGKPINESRADMDFCIDILRYYADIVVEKMETVILETGDDGYMARIEKEPFGVIGCITPWNYPLMQSINKVAPAIAAGCTIVLKPSPLASLTSIMIGELAQAAELPAGVINIVTGGPPLSGADASRRLLEHPALDKVSFTGSTETGIAVLEASARHVRPTSLELGGKGAIIVFDDVDLDMAADWIATGIFLCTGQVCSATSRLLVHEKIASELLQKLKVKAEEIVLGDPQAEDTTMGPLISAQQRTRVMSFINRGIEEGCDLIAGGNTNVVLPAEFAAGAFVEPTILANVPFTSTVWTDEIFGPVLAVNTFSSEDTAIVLANDSPYGLAHAVMSQDAQRCSRVAKQLDAGVVYENCSQMGFVTTPFGGYKRSGFGREWGAVGLEEYVHHKTITTSKDSGVPTSK